MNYVLKTGIQAMDFNSVTAMLTTAYWSPGIGKDEVVQGAQNSALVLGAFDHASRQIGYARTISDKTRFAYILDVIVEESWRGRGVGQALVDAVLHHPELKDVYQWLLVTSTAHDVYRKFGFEITDRAERIMERRDSRTASSESGSGD